MLKCVLSPIARPLKSLAGCVTRPRKNYWAHTANDLFERGKAVKPAKVRELYSISDPYTREEKYVETKPVRALDLNAIFKHGWAQLATANTVEAKRQALNGIIYGVSPTSGRINDYIAISRACVARLCTGTQAVSKDYAHLAKHAWNADETEVRIYSARPDKIIQRSVDDWSVEEGNDASKVRTEAFVDAPKQGSLRETEAREKARPDQTGQRAVADSNSDDSKAKIIWKPEKVKFAFETPKKHYLQQVQAQLKASRISEAKFFEAIDSRYGTLRQRLSQAFQTLERNFLKDCKINKQGLQKAQSLQDIEKAMQEAGDGAIGYIFPDSNIVPVVNVKGDVFALPNFGTALPSAEHININSGVVDTLGMPNPQQLRYAITTHKLHRP